jgi:hypothetical protein
MQRIKIFCFFLITFFTNYAFACSGITAWSPYIYIVKMSGEKNDKIYFNEVLGVLHYHGSEQLTILLKNKIIASVKNGNVCYFLKKNGNVCSPGYYSSINVNRIANDYQTKSKYMLFIQIGELAPKKYTFTNLRVKNTDEYQTQLDYGSMDLCEAMD